MKRFLAAALFLLAFQTYLRISYPGQAPFRDAGDFAAASARLGAAHPPGYPVYVLLGRSFQEALPWANPTYRLNVLSALCGAGSALFLFLILLRFGGLPAALLGTTLGALLPAGLSQFGLSEAYGMNALFAAGLLWGGLFTEGLPAGRRPRAWALLVFAGGVGLGNHQTLLLAAPVLLLFLNRERRRGHLRLRHLGFFAAALALGLSIHLFLPLRAAAGADYVWGEPQTFHGLRQVLTRGDYGAGTLSTRHSTADLSEGLAFWFSVWGGQWGALGGLLGVLALFHALWRKNSSSWGGPAALLWVFTGPVFALLARLEPGSLSQAILQPALVLPGWAAALGVGMLLAAFFRRGRGWGAFALAAWCLLMGLKVVPGLLALDRRWDFLAADYGRNLLRTFPENSTLLMISDQAVFAVGHEQAVSRRRPDLRLLVDAALPWRWRRYRREHPDLFAEGQPDGGAALVRIQGARLPIYTEGMQAGLLDSLCPRGMAARAVPRRDGACLNEVAARGWAWDVYVRRRPPALALFNDHYARTLLQTAASGAFNAGLLLAQDGRQGPARDAYGRALFWNPERMMRWEETF